MATGSSAGPLWTNSARIYVLLPRNAGQTGTSQRPNSRRRGSKAARTSSIRTAKLTPKLSVNRIRSGVRWVYPEVEPASAQRVCVAGLSGPATDRAVESADLETAYRYATATARVGFILLAAALPRARVRGRRTKSPLRGPFNH